MRSQKVRPVTECVTQRLSTEYPKQDRNSLGSARAAACHGALCFPLQSLPCQLQGLFLLPTLISLSTAFNHCYRLALKCVPKSHVVLPGGARTSKRKADCWKGVCSSEGHWNSVCLFHFSAPWSEQASASTHSHCRVLTCQEARADSDKQLKPGNGEPRLTLPVFLNTVVSSQQCKADYFSQTWKQEKSK